MPASQQTVDKPEISLAEIFVLQGDDELVISAYLRVLKDRFAEGSFGDMNFVRLDARMLSKSEMANHINMLPLGSGSRLVVLDEALELFKTKEDLAWMESLLTSMPPTTAVVLVVRDAKKYVKGQMVWQTVGPGHALRKILKDLERKVDWKDCPKPTQRELPEWIANQARELGVEMEGRAAAELANLVGDDLFHARQEIIKAASYAGEGQVVTREMVRLLCSPSREEDIFAMVDAAAQRNPGKALSLFNALLRDQPVQYIFSMVARQFRLLIIAKEIMREGGDDKTIAAEANLHPFVARKLAEQAPRFSMSELETTYRRLDRMDEQSKTGNATLEVMLESLIADLSQ
jgi:DNA polymerase-3 subunit delta